MTKSERKVVKAMNEILECIILLVSQTNNFSDNAVRQIGKAQKAIKACASHQKATRGKK